MSRLSALALLLAAAAAPAGGPAVRPYWVCVTNERSGDVTVIDGATRRVVATIPVGKRPRGVHPSPDGKLLYVALSGSPIAGPPMHDAKGNPVFPAEDPDAGDRSEDGIGVVDLEQRKLVRKLPSGSDPEEFAVSQDGSRLYVSNEDVATASVVSVADGRVMNIVRVKKEPEGVALSPDGRFVYVTCETGGEVFVIDTATNKAVAEIPVGGRPRTVAFLPDGSRAFVPCETAGTITEVDTAGRKVLRVVRLPEGSRPMGTAIAADGRTLFVSTGRAGTVCALDPIGGGLRAAVEVGPRPGLVAGREGAVRGQRPVGRLVGGRHGRDEGGGPGEGRPRAVGRGSGAGAGVARPAGPPAGAEGPGREFDPLGPESERGGPGALPGAGYSDAGVAPPATPLSGCPAAASRASSCRSRFSPSRSARPATPAKAAGAGRPTGLCL